CGGGGAARTLGPPRADRTRDLHLHRVALQLRWDAPPSRGARVSEEHADAGDAVAQPDRGAHHTRQRHERVGVGGEHFSDRLRGHRYGLYTLIVVPLLLPSTSWFSVRS